MIHLLLTLALAVASLPLVASAQALEHFGEFLDSLRGGFREANPRPIFRLETDFRFRDPNGLMWTAPAGIEVDGASIPQVFWSVIGGPFDGPYLNGSVIHDHYCRTKERTAHDTHRSFYYAMRASQVPEWKAALMHWVVSTFGPSWRLERRMTFKTVCSGGAPKTCSSVPEIKNALVPGPAVDLADPYVLAIAVSKTNAVARTLLTSDGRYFDVNAAGPIEASVANIQASAQAYRQVFSAKDFTSSFSRLGVLGNPTGGTIADGARWAGNQIPRLSETVVLTPNTNSRLDSDMPFKFDRRSQGLIEERIDLRSLESATQLNGIAR